VNSWLQDDSDPHRYKRNYKAIDAIFRLAGTGSLGLNRYALLLKARDKDGEKYRLLDLKQATVSSLLPWIQQPQPAWSSEAVRVVQVQHRMQNRPPALLGTTFFNGHPYIVQEMQPEKDSINLLLLRDRFHDMCRVIQDMALLTASAQIRSSGRQGSAIADDLIAFAADPHWQKPLLQYAKQYAEKVKGDYESFVKVYK
jgi:uncharacterized protein (DUF2252 family)